MTDTKGASVLASLTAEVMAEKKSEARKLTPVAGEVVPFPLERAGIPNDTGIFMSNERMFEHAKQLRQFAADAIAIADGLDAMLATSSDPAETPSDPAAEVKSKEAAADAKFAAKFEAQKAEAQAATFKEPSPTVEAAGDTGSDWVCPTHDVPGIEKTSPKTGRTFIGCPDCNQFKR